MPPLLKKISKIYLYFVFDSDLTGRRRRRRKHMFLELLLATPFDHVGSKSTERTQSFGAYREPFLWLAQSVKLRAQPREARRKAKHLSW